MDIKTIINEADIRVPNSFSGADKVDWLNEINNQFFDVVKIPKIEPFTGVNGTAEYTLATGVRSKNIDYVLLGTSQYDSFDDMKPGRNFWTFDDGTHKIKLSSVPIASGQGYVRYFQIGVTTFLATDLEADPVTATPDAPAEYHWLYVVGLSEKIAQAMDDAVKANNYGGIYRNGLLTAAQNYLKAAK